MDGFYVNGMAAYTRNHYDSNRNILFPGVASTAGANTDGNQYSANIDGGYDWHLSDRVTVGPVAGVQYVHLDVDSFNEAGAGLASLAVNGQDVDSLRSRLGARADYHVQMAEQITFAAELTAEWQHEFLDDSRGIIAGFGSGLAPFSVQTSRPDRDAGVVGAGINFTFRNRVTLFADYNLTMWRTNYYDQTVNGGCKVSW
jgi:outer membrane autotransporter protein